MQLKNITLNISGIKNSHTIYVLYIIYIIKVTVATMNVLLNRNPTHRILGSGTKK